MIDPIRVKVELGGEDTEWKGAFLMFNRPSYSEMMEYQSQMESLSDESGLKVAEFVINELASRLSGGMVPENGELREVSSNDVKDLPMTVINDVMVNIFGGVEKKAL